MVQTAVLKISRRFQFSTETVENVQWGWNRNFVRCLRNRTYGSRVSSYDNRLISFSNFFLNHSSTLFVFISNWIQTWPSLKVKHWVSRSGIPARKTHLQVYKFNCLQFIFYHDEFKVWLNIEEWMCLSPVTCSSVALATPFANSKKMQSAVLMISLRLQFSADTVELKGQSWRKFSV